MDFVVKEACSFFRHGVKCRAGTVVRDLTPGEVKRYQHLIMPVVEENDGETAAAASPTPRKRRRAAVKDDG